MRTQAALANSATLRLISRLTIVGLLACPVFAQVGDRHSLPSSGGAQTFLLANKQPLSAEVLSVAGDQVTLTVFASGGSMQRTMALSDFTPESALRAMEAVASNDDVNQQLSLARFAADQGLIASARNCLARARTLSGDPKLGADIESTIAASGSKLLIEQFNQSVKDGRFDVAQRQLKTALARYPDQIDAKRGRELAQQLEQARAEVERGERKAEVQAEQKEAVDQRDRLLRPLQHRLQRGQEEYKRGLSNSKNGSTADQAFTNAIKNFNTVLKGCDELTKKYPNDEVLGSEVGRLSNSAKSQQIDALLASGSLYLTRGSANAAMGRVNEVLLLDPGNKQALALRGRVEMAANRGWGYGW